MNKNVVVGVCFVPGCQPFADHAILDEWRVISAFFTFLTMHPLRSAEVSRK